MLQVPRPIRWLIVAVVAIGACSGLLAWALTRVPARAATLTLADLPRDASIVGWIDFARLRAHPTARSIRAWRAPGTVPGAAPHLGHQACGFDPVDRVDAVAWAMRGDSIRLAERDAVVLATGRFSAAERLACLTGLAREAGMAFAPAGRLRGHELFDFTERPAPSSPAGPVPRLTGTDFRAATLERGALFAERSDVAAALETVDRRAPGADQNPLLRELVGALGRDPEAYVAADLRTLSTALSRDITEATRALGTLGLVLAPTAQGAVVGLDVTSTGVRFVAVARYPVASDARDTAAALTSALPLLQLAVSALLTAEAERVLSDLRRASAGNPALAADVATIERALAVLRRLPASVTARANGVFARVELEVAPRDLDALTAGIQAASNAVTGILSAPFSGSPPMPP